MHLIVEPDIPQWAVVNADGLELVKLLFEQGLSPHEAAVRLSNIDYIEIEAMCGELIDLFSAREGEIINTEKTLTSRTTIAMISVTDRCNLSCPHCYVDAIGRANYELTTKEHKMIARGLVEQLVVDSSTSYRVTLTGGEPFMHSDIMNIIRIYQAHGFDVAMSTNGLLISSEEARFLAESGVTLSISLDGASASVHDGIRGLGSFDWLMMQLRMLIDSGVRVGINHLVHEKNFQELESTIQLAFEFGCTGFNPINLVQLGRACESQLRRVPETEIFSRIANHLIVNPEQRYLFEKTSLFSSIGAALLAGVTCSSCGIGNRPCVYIDSVGRVYPCANTQRDEFVLGDIRRQSMAEILSDSHPVLVKLRALSVDNLNEKCASCGVRSFCGGDCRGETYNVTGNLHAPYVACQDRYNSIIEMMWIVAKNPELFEARANEFIFNASRGV